jgi:hypothetical protein
VTADVPDFRVAASVPACVIGDTDDVRLQTGGAIVLGWLPTH